MQTNFLIIDGSSMLVTAYYGNLPKEILFEKDIEKKKLLYDKIMHTSTGVYTNAVYSMCKTLLKIFKDQQPQHLAIVFDKTRNTFRRELYADYKGTRGETPAPLREQFVTMESLLENIGIVTLYSDKYEADDFAGSIVKRFESPECSMTFMTKDHDYLQLISPYTRGWMVQAKQDAADALFDKYNFAFASGSEYKKAAKLPDKVFEFTPEIVLNEEGVTPIQIIDKKAIGGDASDNIPGVKGVSGDTAALLLSEYDSIEEIYATIETCTSEKEEKELAAFWKENLGIKMSPIKKLKAGHDMAFLSKTLATISTEAPIPENLCDYEFKLNKEKLKEEFKRLEFASLLTKIDG